MDEKKAAALKAENRVLSFFASTYGSLMAEVADRYGEEGSKLVYDAYRKSVKASCTPLWKRMKRVDAEGYAEWLLDDLMEGYEFEYVEKTPKSVRLKLKACPLAVHFRKKGFGDLAMIFCDVDYHMIEDFNEITGAHLAFERERMLMQGDDHCNHHIYVEE